MGKLSRIKTCGSKPTRLSSCWRSWALTAHRLAAWRVKVVRWMRPGPGTVAPVAAEVVVQALVGVDAEELADAFDG